MIWRLPAVGLRPACADVLGNCAQPFDAGLKIAACTKLLADPGLTPALRARCLHNRGAGHHINGAFERARADYTAALALDGKRSRTFKNRADVHMGLCQPDRALADYDRAVVLDGARRVMALRRFLKAQDMYDGANGAGHTGPGRAPPCRPMSAGSNADGHRATCFYNS